MGHAVLPAHEGNRGVGVVLPRLLGRLAGGEAAFDQQVLAGSREASLMRSWRWVA